MRRVFVGSDALEAGALTRSALRWNYRRIFPDIYAPANAELSVSDFALAASMWTGGRGIIAGAAASALHGARWVPTSVPIEIIWRNGRPPPGIVVRNERIDDDEICDIGGLLVTTPERTALDLARHLPRNQAVARLDALANAVDLKSVDVLALARRYPAARHIRRAVTALNLMDGGAQSPRETWLRLLLIDEWLDPVSTQIVVSDGRRTAHVDLGYDEPMIGLEYEGAHHSADRGTYVYDIGRGEFIERQGWIVLKVVKEHSAAFIKSRVREAFARCGYPPRLRPRPRGRRRARP